MIALGYIGAFFIGLTLGLMGSGGSILTVPLLVYLFLIDPVIATAYSLFIVGATSAAGAIKNYLNGSICIKTGLIISVPSFLSVYLTRRFIVTRLPEEFTYGHFTMTRDNFIMALFATVMMLGAASMIFGKINESGQVKKVSYAIALPFIAAVGVLMGLVGAGGGFLIMPMLVFFGGLSMRKAVGTSLLIVTINSLTGFAGDMYSINIDWHFLLTFTMLSVFGIFAGTYLHKYINERQLKRGFGFFILLMGAAILIREINI